MFEIDFERTKNSFFSFNFFVIESLLMNLFLQKKKVFLSKPATFIEIGEIELLLFEYFLIFGVKFEVKLVFSIEFILLFLINEKYN